MRKGPTFDELGMQVHRDLCESRIAETSAPPHLIIPLDGAPTPSGIAPAMTITALANGNRDNLVDPIVIIAIGFPGMGALHVGQSADELRATAAACLRSADLLDGGRGKQ